MTFVYHSYCLLMYNYCVCDSALLCMFLIHDSVCICISSFMIYVHVCSCVRMNMCILVCVCSIKFTLQDVSDY